VATKLGLPNMRVQRSGWYAPRFELAHAGNNDGSTSILLENGEKVELPIYEISFVLKK
jgi:hypothetical protein